MASSIQLFGKKAESFNDLDLIVLVQFLAEVVSQSGEYPTLRNLVEQWTANVRLYGPGVLDLALDGALKMPAAKGELVAALNTVKAKIAEFGSIIPADLLNSRNIAPGVTFNDYSVPILRDATARLERLID